MSADCKARSPFGKKTVRETLNEMLDFGPETDLPPTSVVSGNLNSRLEAIVKKLKEMNERMDRLASQL